MKEQRGFRLEKELLDRIDDYCDRMDMSYNSIISQCVKLALPFVESPSYYNLRIKGWRVEQLAAEITAMFEARGLAKPPASPSPEHKPRRRP